MEKMMLTEKLLTAPKYLIVNIASGPDLAREKSLEQFRKLARQVPGGRMQVSLCRGGRMQVSLCSYLDSFLHSGYFCSASSSLLLLRGTPDYSIDIVPHLTHLTPTNN